MTVNIVARSITAHTCGFDIVDRVEIAHKHTNAIVPKSPPA